MGAALLSAALCCTHVAKADQHTPLPPATQAPPSQPEVNAEEARAALKHRVDAFVRAITRNPELSDEGPIVRWNTPICLLVAGLTPEDIRAVSAKILDIGSIAGAPLGGPQCQPNFVIVATPEPERVINAWYARDKKLFGDASPARVRQFVEGSQSRPVRLWYNIDMGRKSGMRNGHFIPSNTRAESSAFVGNTIFDFFSVFAIIDTRRAEHITLDQLAAYVAMAGLTNVDLDAELGSAPSILQLFAHPDSEPSGLSTWDAAFLKALYQSNQTSRSQRFDIAERVARDISR